jgi:hypothetical protein
VFRRAAESLSDIKNAFCYEFVARIGDFVTHYNTVRLHSAIGYVTPQDLLDGRQAEIHAERDNKLEAAREARKQRRQLNPEPTIA